MREAVRESRTLRRLWRPRAVANVVVPLIVVLVIAAINNPQSDPLHGLPRQWRTPVHYGLVVVGAVFAAYAVRAFATSLSAALDDYVGLGRARYIATSLSVILYVVVVLMAMDAANFNLGGLLVGSALTAVVVGIAGQASLSNIIAGLVILFARPYSAGMYLTARAGAFGGVEYSGQVWDVSLFYTTLHSGGQEIRIPNSIMVAAVVVARPQELDVYIPVTLPRSTDLPAALERLQRTITSCTATRREANVALESVTDVGYVVGVRVFVAGEAERHAVEHAIALVVQQEQPAPSAPAASDGDAPPAGGNTGDGRVVEPARRPAAASPAEQSHAE